MVRKHQKNSSETTERSYLNIGTFECWKCKKGVKAAWVTTDSTFYGPERFTDNELSRARIKGVKIEEIASRTLGGEKYMANTCIHCGSFVGKFFIDDYLGSEEYKEEI